MNYINQYIEFILHLNIHLTGLVAHFGLWIYAILFFIIFCETGLFFLPFLPGESLLFAIGTIAATGSLNVHGLALLLSLAAIVGGFTNYAVGYTIGKHLFPPDKKSNFSSYIA